VKDSSAAVRSAFLDFFRKQGHSIVQSAPLVPQGDPTLMFTNAGMVQFKDVFVGKEARAYTKAASCQKCIRISGKHNDLENVGVTARHHTFFEMLGNFSFGDYFKEATIAYAWELLTKELGISKERLVITVFGADAEAPGVPADDDARRLWKKVTGFGDDRILGLGAKDNFWQMGDTGPCGPCTEIHYYMGDGAPDLSTFGQEPDASGRGWVEIWNLVFMQFDRSIGASGPVLAPLPKPCVDTGAGLERLACVLAGKVTNYDTDVLRALVEAAAQASGKRYGGTDAPDDVSMRVIADHARTAAFLISEGIFPDRAGREYVLRRVMRRAIRHGHRLGIERPFLHEVALRVVELMASTYPELGQRRELIATVAEQEEVRFRQTIDRGLRILDEEVAQLRSKGAQVLPGDVAFKLYDTYGFPLDLTEVIARERDFRVDEAGYERALAEQRARSEGSKVGEAAVADVWRVLQEAAGGVATRFTGYETEAGQAQVVAMARGGELVQEARAGDTVFVVVAETPFYAESGGQVGDTGVLRGTRGSNFEANVVETQRPIGALIVHTANIRAGAVKVGDEVELEVDHGRRQAIRRNHSATHLLHWALRVVLGEQATQKGSLVGPDRLRFDFSHGKPVSKAQLARIEDLVNDKILSNAPVLTEVLPMDEARARGAMAIFEEKYGDVVRVLTMTADSVELCGGTHARALGDIGLFKVVGESGVAAGVRRLEAVTGLSAVAHVRELERTVMAAAEALGAQPGEVPARIDKLQAERKQLDKEVAELKRKAALGGGGGTGVEEWIRRARDIPGGKCLAVRIDGADGATLREVAEQLRDKLGNAVVLVGAVTAGKVALVCAVSKSLTARHPAGEVVKRAAAAVGGSGGGRPDMAQAGGTAVDRIDDALAVLDALVSGASSGREPEGPAAQAPRA
jgi:alanyl-tRNA synthetase